MYGTVRVVAWQLAWTSMVSVKRFHIVFLVYPSVRPWVYICRVTVTPHTHPLPASWARVKYGAFSVLLITTLWNEEKAEDWRSLSRPAPQIMTLFSTHSQRSLQVGKAVAADCVLENPSNSFPSCRDRTHFHFRLKNAEPDTLSDRLHIINNRQSNISR